MRTSGGCWRTLHGLADFAIVQSYLSTAAKWGIDALDALTRLFTDRPLAPARNRTPVTQAEQLRVTVCVSGFIIRQVSSALARADPCKLSGRTWPAAASSARIPCPCVVCIGCGAL